MHDKNNDLWLLTFFAKNPHHKCSSVFQKCLLPVKKKETYLIWYYIILYTFINCPVFIDIKQTLHYKVEYWSRVLESERCLFFMHCRHMFFSHFFTGWSFAMVVLDSFFFIWETKKVVAGCDRQVVILYNNNCMGICLGRLSIGCLRCVVVL